MKKLTIFTPAFNRAYCLHHCYESLKRQTCKDFIWLVIDDGSTDNTKELIETWQEEGKVEINYCWQKNQGMHGAHNTAYEKIDTELNVCIDSDDYMPDDAVEKILAFWAAHGNEKVSGMVGLDADKDNQILGTTLPKHLKQASLFDLYYKHGVTGDKKLVYRTALTKKYPYPIFENEKYVGLAYKYYMLDKDYELLLMNEVICHVEYLADGSSMNMLKQYHNNPLGFSFYRKELMKLPFADTTFKFRQAIHYVSSNLISKNGAFIKETPEKILTALAFPFGFLLYLYVLSKNRRVNV
ncbi:glycosyltransferase family A protein [Oceanobacillus sojae]|uniref:glycosyltransferase family 2 protein n=1 Tax=Oceanobacillus sojae TaxID=582851 RepID=UPI0021A576C5|nr:glycosyltransferase family A protein [Oceanobacillus sojae]MCT1904362.1 glycosyltransferase family 2 protein [Oceanobacillus sojae]